MGRWVPDAQGRLIEAAMDLYSERGFEQTTVAEIATRAGLTERTFFRHFPDKREVLFFGSDQLQNAMVDALVGAPAHLAPIDAVAASLRAIAPFFHDRRPQSRRRQAIINANPELQERERNKLAKIAAALSNALERRGVKDAVATLAGEIGVAIFRVAFESWLTDDKARDFDFHVRASLEELRAVNAPH